MKAGFGGLIVCVCVFFVCVYSVNESMHVKELVVVEFLLTFKSN